MGTHLIENWPFLKEVMSDWLGFDGKITSHKNLKLSSSERPLDVDRGYFC